MLVVVQGAGCGAGKVRAGTGVGWMRTGRAGGGGVDVRPLTISDRRSRHETSPAPAGPTSPPSTPQLLNSTA